VNNDFVTRLRRTFGDASMAVVARRLGIPHATVRNYYQGRLPAPEVLIKIASETGISLNWLLMGTGGMYASEPKGLDLGRLIENKIGELIDKRLETSSAVIHLGNVDDPFDVEGAIERYDDPSRIIKEWFLHEGRQAPADYGVAFFRGWETFSPSDKAAALRDSKQMLDRVLKNDERQK
jgi:transcriptional regulator with XRE-family HTH domain